MAQDNNAFDPDRYPWDYIWAVMYAPYGAWLLVLLLEFWNVQVRLLRAPDRTSIDPRGG